MIPPCKSDTIVVYVDGEEMGTVLMVEDLAGVGGNTSQNLRSDV